MPFQPEWFVPHFEFRFPLLGDATYDGVKLELRQAIEPWNVLGEETVATATARYVDSSVERLEVKVRGMTGRRHVVTLQRPPRAAASHGIAGRVRGGRTFPGLAAAELPAPHDRRPYAAGVRSLRSLVEPLDRRLHVARLASRGRELCDVPGQCPGCRESPRVAVPGDGPYGRTGAACRSASTTQIIR